jgi:hypothetical protein
MERDRTPLTGEWVREARQVMQEREAVILRKVLQQPDYPPLPECPRCHVTPERITQSQEPPSSGAGMAVLIDFAPCGHGFQVSEAEIVRA